MELSSSNAPTIPAKKPASDLPAKEKPPHTGKEAECGYQNSQELTTSSVPKAPVKHSETAHTLPAKEDTETMELTSSYAPNVPAKQQARDLPAKEKPPHTGKEAECSYQCSRESTTSSSVPKAPVKHSASAHILPAKEDTETMELTSSYAPTIPAKQHASDLPAKEKPPHTGKEAESALQCSQELTKSSVPKGPVKHSATVHTLPAKEDTEMMEGNTTKMERINLSSSPAQSASNTTSGAAVLGMKALATIVSRAKVTNEPEKVTGWLPENDNIHPLKTGLTFGQFYNILLRDNGSTPSSSNARRLPVFKKVCQKEEVPRKPKTDEEIKNDQEFPPPSSSNARRQPVSKNVWQKEEVPREPTTDEKIKYDKEFPPLQKKNRK